LLSISRDPEALQQYLPLLERCANFIETRRDPQKNLFWAGPAGNLLAPSYAGYRRPDGTYDKAYLVGLGITYIAALDRLIELEKLAGATDKVKVYTERRDLARRGLPQVTTADGYFLKALDPDGTPHGVYGAEKHGYFEAVCNHDAICFRVADDDQARKIMDKIRSIPGLRPHDLIITNCPSLDDMYVPASGWLWQFGTWVNGGHWTTCEARMMLAYSRLGCYDDARRAMLQMMKFARAFRLDNPLVDFGNAVYQPREPINLCYDSFGAPAALLRGLFEYLYRADGLALVPHIPPGITRLQQDFPIRFGRKQVYLATVGSGPVTAVTVNGQPWTKFDARSVELPYAATPDEAVVVLALGHAAPVAFEPRRPGRDLPAEPPADAKTWSPDLFPVISTNDLPLRIGADSDGQSRFLGDVARARLFRRALTADEIAAAAPNKPGPLDQDPALVGDWQFTQRHGDVFPNRLGDFLPAKVVGEVTVADGPDGKVLRLGGKGYLEVAPDARLNLTADLTMEAWVRPDMQAPGGARILDKSRVGTANGYLLDTCPGNSLRLIVERGTLTFDARLPTDAWTHAAATVDATGRLALFVNGRRVATRQQATPAELDTLSERIARLRRFAAALAAAGLGHTYEAAHARLAIGYHAATYQRLRRLADGQLARLPAASQYAADKSYFATTAKLCDGLEKTLAPYENAKAPQKQRLFELFRASQSSP
jgi:hypothetical protein